MCRQVHRPIDDFSCEGIFNVNNERKHGAKRVLIYVCIVDIYLNVMKEGD